MDVSKIPMTHGMEVEQFNVPNEIRSDVSDKYWGGWHRDPSGPVEMEFGPGKHVKRLIDGFNQTARQYSDRPWEWRSSDGSSGAGSHVHFNVDRLADRDDTISAWTIAHNSVLDLLPVFAPFFCHNWEKGFREGTQYSSYELNVEHWAQPATRRYSTDTMAQYHDRPRSVSRSYNAVTMNPEQSSGKPLTMELRLSDSHPAFALTGCYYLRKIVKRCLERDWSVKIDRQESDTSNVVDAMYQRVYRIDDDENMIANMQEPLKIVFEEGREVPGLENEYDCPYDLLEAILKDITPRGNTNRADCRASELVRYAGDLVRTRNSDPFVANVSEIPNPARNKKAIWHMDRDEFSWDCGPEY